MNSNGVSSFFGSDWLGAFLIIAVLFGGFGGFGFGGGRGYPGPEPASVEYVQNVVNNQATQTGLRDILWLIKSMLMTMLAYLIIIWFF